MLPYGIFPYAITNDSMAHEKIAYTISPYATSRCIAKLNLVRIAILPYGIFPYHMGHILYAITTDFNMQRYFIEYRFFFIYSAESLPLTKSIFYATPGFLHLILDFGKIIFSSYLSSLLQLRSSKRFKRSFLNSLKIMKFSKTFQILIFPSFKLKHSNFF